MLPEYEQSLIQSVVNVVIQSSSAEAFLDELDDRVHFALFANAVASVVGDADLDEVAKATGIQVEHVRQFFDGDPNISMSVAQRLGRYANKIREREEDDANDS